MKTFPKYFLFFLLLNAIVNAQTKISGKVIFKNKGIQGVSVTLKDTYDGATTDSDGNFSFETAEKGAHILVFSHQDFMNAEESITIGNQPIMKNISLKEKISEISAVVISAGSIEAGDKKRATAALTPMDVYNTAGANGSMSEGVKFYPGVQKTGESEGLFVRGGTGAETKFFMDGNLVNNYFTASVSGIPGQDRFNTDIFKGVSFSSGGYSALYGQALSAILALESIDFPDKTSAGFSIFPFSATGNFQKLNREKDFSFGIQAKYFNLSAIQKLLPENNNFTTAPRSFGVNGNLRWRTKNGGFFKYYGSFDTNSLALSQPSLELNYDTQQPAVKGNNTFHNFSFRQKFGKYVLNAGASFSIDEKNVDVGILNQNNKIGDVEMDSKGTYFNQKTVLERKIRNASNVKAGYEINFSDDVFSTKIFGAEAQDFTVKNTNFSVFGEANLALSSNFSFSGGLRAEHSSFLNLWNLAPRLAAAYRFSRSWSASLAYGTFFQNPDPQYLNSKNDRPFQEAAHYIFQVQKSENGRTFRTEVFYKAYKNLEKTVTENFLTLPENTVGKGFARGLEFFWSDRKTFQNFNYRISYSFLDSRRDYLNYPRELFPSFASKHNLSVTAAKFVSAWKSGISASFVYASPRPFYDIVAQNGSNILLSSGASKEYKSLNISGYYLPNIGKKEAKSFTILVAGVNNVLGFKNNFGYRFSMDGLRSAAVLPSFNTMVYVGAIFNFGIDKTQQTIDNL